MRATASSQTQPAPAIPESLAADMAERAAAYLVPRKYRAATVGDERVLAWAAGFLSGGARNLYLWGEPGRGKTWTAWGLVAFLVRESELNGYGGRDWSHPLRFAGTNGVLGDAAVDLFARQRRLFDSGAEPEGRDAFLGGPLEQACQMRLVLLDDLGVERVSPWVQEQLDRVVNTRYTAERPTIVTTNLAPGDIGRHLGERIASRLAENTLVLEMTGPDRRRVVSQGS